MKNIIWKKMIIAILCMCIITGAQPVDNTPACEAKSLKSAIFAYLDVGQGNAELIKVGGKSVLIDTGKQSEYDELLMQLDKLNVTKINTLIVSHPDSDHMESADMIIQKYKVKKLIMPKVKASTQCYQRMMSAVKKHKVKVLNPESGQQIELASGCKAKVLSVDASEDKNEASIVMRVTYGDRSFLYMGDATARVEMDIIEAGENIASDVYLMSHHGSDTANGVLFVKTALASGYKHAVISVGADNTYGHPDRFVVNRAKKYAAKVYRTDLDGAIVYRTDGNTLKTSFIKVDHSSSSSYTPSEPVNNSEIKDATAVEKGYVYITRTGSKYHKDGCRYLKAGKIKVKLSQAKDKGMTPCSVCY